MQARSNHQAPAAAISQPVSAASAGIPLVHVVRPDIYVVEKPTSSFWGNQGGSLLALIGVLLTIYVKWISDSVARKFDLKQKIYLDMADAVLESSNSVAQLVDVDIPFKDSATKFNKSIGPIVKAELVAPDKLSAAITAYKDQCGLLFMSLVKMRIEVERHKVDLSNADVSIDRWRRQIDPLLVDLQRVILDGIADAGGHERHDRLSGQLQYLRIELDKATDVKQKTAAEMYRCVNDMGLYYQKNQLALTKLVNPILELVQRDLKFGGFNRRSYQERQEKTAKAAHAALDGLRDEVSRKLGPDRDDK